MKTISAQFDSYEDARSAADKLAVLGVSRSEISLVSNNSDNWYTESDDSSAGESAVSGASVGAAIGGAGGLLTGLGLMAIPGVGPVVAAGWLAATAVGAVAGAATGGAVGGLVGAMTDAGVPERDANLYAEGVRRGGTLVSARVEDRIAPDAQATLDGLKPVNLNERERTYREEGWSRFDPDAAPYEADQIEKERSRYRIGSL